ncbi:MAG TPA: Ig-like domain-containing protein [Longimicrobiales bacterium]|nr:Ig-like domain-containing protein [Longimicrobiales bacterium]
MFALLALVVAAQGAPVPGQSLPPSPIARIIVEPEPVVEAGGTLQLRPQALDENGQPIQNVAFLFSSSVNARFEGYAEPNGLVRSAAVGTLPVTVAATVPGTRPVFEVVNVRMVPGPAARVEIGPDLGALVAGQRFRMEARSYSALGDVRDDRVSWSSSDSGVIRVTEDGLVTAVAPGEATLTASVATAVAERRIRVLPVRIATVEVTPDRVQARQGDVIRFTVTARDENGGVIEGLTPTWSFSPGHGLIRPDGSFVGYEAGEYVVTASFGNHSADAVIRLSHRNVRRPLEVVGRVPRTLFSTEEVWVHPNGRVAYLGSGAGGDRLYVIDITDPARPVVVDSLIANTRRVNDVMTTPDGRFLVHTREGAADRRNGIVIASLEDPWHPRVIAHFTDRVTSGVHSAFVYHQPEFGTHVYATNNGNNSLDIIDITDPYNPTRVGRFKINDFDAGNYLHDVDVQDGIAYLSYWNEGLVILDVGNGIRGGSPSNPVMISQFKYDLNELYRDVEVEGGPGFIRGTHTAWRHRDYVFIADEVFAASAPRGAPEAASDRAWGRLQVIDVSDIENPRSVAWYEPEHGGVHNVWAAGDTLYMGAYNAGFRVFDISGELMGDLRAQGREIGHLNTADDVGYATGRAMTWGVVVKDGLAYVNDNNNGLWIIRIGPPQQEPPVP